jgi:rhodanese-related sulfurtransferase
MWEGCRLNALEAYSIVESACYVDVREEYEFEAGHIKGSIHIPIGDISTRWHELLTDKPIVVVCQIGQRSGLVTEFLRKEDLNAHNLEGGLEAWERAGLPLVAQASEAAVVDGWARDLSGRRLSD